MKNVYYFSDIKNENLKNVINSKGLVNIKKGKNAISYHQVYSGFDIETTQLLNNKHAYMYHWQISINNYVIFGRKWKEFVELLELLKEYLELSESKRLIIWVANLSFEFAFFRKWVNVTHIFAKEMQKPLLVEIDNCIEFREALSISGGSLAYLAKNYTITQKMTGDLDYSIMRNSKTQLSETELQYCYNDVKILSEWSEYIFEKYIIPEKYIPLTKTAIVRKKVKKGVTKEVRKAIQLCFPASLKMYNLMMRYLYRGGYVHSNIQKTGYTIFDVDSFDFTSSYPAVMLHDYYPCGIYKPKHNISYNEYLTLNTEYCTMAYITFYNIKSTTPHSIESRSKCVTLENPLIDNGRVRKADVMSVFITELDFLNYKDFYKWTGMTINKCWYCVRGKLPEYLLHPLIEQYTIKQTLKKLGEKDTTEYAESKENVNSNYGMCCTKIIAEEIFIDDNGDWKKEPIEIDYEKEKRKAFLLPQWGIYISSHARRNLLYLCKKMSTHTDSDVCYMDTDSLKITNLKQNKRIIHEWNKKMIGINKKMCIERDLDYSLFKDLGCLDWETKKGKIYTRFKTLGAKRYIYEDIKGIHSTIAGLPKGSFIEECNRLKKDAFDIFSNGMNIKISNKLASCYNKDAHSDYVEDEIMTELSSVCLFPVEFTLKLDKFYLNTLDNILKSKGAIYDEIY